MSYHHLVWYFFPLGNQYLTHKRGKKKQIYFFFLLCKIFQCNFSLNMLGPATQYLIFFFFFTSFWREPWSKHSWVLRKETSEKWQQKWGELQALWEEGVISEAEHVCWLLLDSWAGFGDAVASALWDRSLEGSCRLLTCAGRMPRRAPLEAAASVSSAYPINPTKPVLTDLKMHFSSNPAQLPPCSFLAAASRVLPLPLCFPAFWKALHCVSSLNLYFFAALH